MNRHITRLLPIAGLTVVLLGAGGARAASEGVTLDEWPKDRGSEVASLQNGARLFANYCLGCHSANLVRWNRLQQIGLDDKQIKDYLIPGNQKVGDTMKIAMTPTQAKAWFGKVPPDLSVITRARRSFEHQGTDYIYTLLRSYYRDNASPTGWNNVVYPNIGMPNIFWERQGPREATIAVVHFNTDPKTGAVTRVRTTEVFDAQGYRKKSEAPMQFGLDDTSFSFKPVDPQRAAQFDSDVADLVGFLAFITDPTHGTRVQVGVWVLVFLALFTLAAWRLNAVYWKDVH